MNISFSVERDIFRSMSDDDSIDDPDVTSDVEITIDTPIVLQNVAQESKKPEAEMTAIEKEKREVDSRSVYIGNVDYGTVPVELQQHFSVLGVVNRVTIMINKVTGRSKGFAYLEFATSDAKDKAIAELNGSTFRDRLLKVSAKRTNIRGFNRGRGAYRGRGGYRGVLRAYRGRGGINGRGRGHMRFTPYLINK